MKKNKRKRLQIVDKMHWGAPYPPIRDKLQLSRDGKWLLLYCSICMKMAINWVWKKLKKIDNIVRDTAFYWFLLTRGFTLERSEKSNFEKKNSVYCWTWGELISLNSGIIWNFLILLLLKATWINFSCCCTILYFWEELKNDLVIFMNPDATMT